MNLKQLFDFLLRKIKYSFLNMYLQSILELVKKFIFITLLSAKNESKIKLHLIIVNIESNLFYVILKILYNVLMIEKFLILILLSLNDKIPLKKLFS